MSASGWVALGPARELLLCDVVLSASHLTSFESAPIGVVTERHTLEELLLDEPRGLHAERVVELGLWMCDALAGARHAPHDLSTTNVLVVQRNGLVQGVELPEVTPGSHLVLTNDIATGTSPERLCGLACDARADLYSVGCILFQLSEGRAPFEGRLQDIVAKHVMVGAPRLRRTPASLASIIGRLLEKEPADRYQSIESLRLALYAVLDECSEPTRSAA